MSFSLASAKREFGGISNRNRKMPGSAFALPPSKCQVGGKLAQIEGSTCHKCYAVKSERMYPSVRKGWGDNYLKATKMIAEMPERWAQAMTFQIKHWAKKNDEPFHRWFDAGDLQSVEMLKAIVLVCEMTPEIAHWIPTREASIVKQWRAQGGIEPANLVIRISSTMVGDGPIAKHSHTSTVHKHGESYVGRECPSDTAEHRAASEDGKTANCAACRSCWSKDVAQISYPLH